MKLIEQKTLYFKKGTSDKVYEVDLCQISDDKFVVNFRFGRRNGNLKDGTKTVLPVEEDRAREIFNELIQAKIAKGYSDTQQNAEEAFTATETSLDLQENQHRTPVKDPRELAVLKRLREGQQSSSNWTLERAVWKAGEFQIRDAAPLMTDFLGKTGMLDYAILWAWGRCGESMMLPYVKRLIQRRTNYKNFDNRALRRVAFSTAVTLAKGFDLSFYKDELIKELPAALQEVVEDDNSEALLNLLATIDDPYNIENLHAFEKLYLLNPPDFKKWFLDFIRKVPFHPGKFQFLKHIFKLSEQLNDAEVYGLLAHRIEISRPFYSKPSYCWGDSFYVDFPDGGYQQVKYSDLTKPDPPVSYSNNTRNYLRKRIWKHLNKVGSFGSRHYVRLAAAILAEVKDEHGKEPFCHYYYSYENSGGGLMSVFRAPERREKWHDRFNHFHAVNHILYGNSQRYQLAGNKMTFECSGWKPSDPLPESREESFPQLWNQSPDILLQLILESQAEIVHQFAVKILKEHPQVLADLDEDALTRMLEIQYKCTADLALEAAVKILNDRHTAGVLRALLNSSHSAHRQEAFSYLARHEETVSQNAELLAVALGSIQEASRKYCRDLLQSWTVAGDKMTLTLNTLITWCENSPHEEYRQALVFQVKNVFTQAHKYISLDEIGRLLAHALTEIQEIGAILLVGHGLPAKDLPAGFLTRMLQSNSSSMRESALQLMAQFSDKELLERQELIESLMTHPDGAMRGNARPVFLRLCGTSLGNAFELSDKILSLLIRGRLSKETLNELRDFVIKHLIVYLKCLSKERIKKLLTVKVAAANQVGGALMPLLKAGDFSNLELSFMLKNPTALIRQNARNLLNDNLSRFQQDPLSFVGALDSEWQDARDYVFDLFKNKIDDLDSETLIAVCDSTDDRVQRFGRQLLMQHFEQEDGLLYIMRLSEHPSSNLQLFVSSFLESQVSGQLDKAAELLPFFKNCLTKVNRGRVIKQRLYRFIEQESLNSAEMAAIYLPLIQELSASCGVEMKANCIRTLVLVQKKWGAQLQEVIHGV